jgi:hypothetical protein
MQALFIALVLAQTPDVPVKQQPAPSNDTLTKIADASYLARHAEVLNSVYGGKFTIGGSSLIEGGEKGEVKAERWRDAGQEDSILDTVCADDSTAPDQRWIGGELRIRAIDQRDQDWDFGVDRGRGFERLFEVRGRELKVTGSKIMDLSGDPFRWMCQRVDASREYSSEIRANRDVRDHLITYRIRGLETEEAVWMLFWETRLDSDRTERDSEDFHGLAVEVRALTPCPQPHINGTQIGQPQERATSSVFRSDNLGLQLDGGGGGGGRGASVDMSGSGDIFNPPSTGQSASSTGNTSSRRTRNRTPTPPDTEDPPLPTPPGGVPKDPPPTIDPPGEDFPPDPPAPPPPGWEDGDPPGDPPPPTDDPPDPRDGDYPSAPEPGTAVLVAIGAALLGRRKRHG